tara:strand:- start:1228 stop:1407 length:180 start_codon:yes stop_codon:yes gene_type:complete
MEFYHEYYETEMDTSVLEEYDDVRGQIIRPDLLKLVRLLNINLDKYLMIRDYNLIDEPF